MYFGSNKGIQIVRMGEQVCEFTPDKERVHCPVMSGTYGPRGTFSDGNLSWSGAAIDMNPRYAAESITASRDAHQQHRAARLLMHLAEALDVLRFGRFLK